MVLLAGCASSEVAPSAEVTPAHASAARATSTGDTPTVSDRLTTTVTYDGGQERFDPLPASYRPKITARDAFEASAAEVDPASLGTEEKPTVLLASYTNFSTGKHATVATGTMDPVAAAKSDEASKPWWTTVPVWYIRYQKVPVSPMGAPAAPGQTYHQPKTVVEEMFVPVSADTGKVLLIVYGTADRTPTSWPPTAGNGETAKSRPGSAIAPPTTAR